MSSPSPEPVAVGSSSENCSHIKKLGYVVGKRVNLYGEHMVFVSDPFDDGDCVAVQATSAIDPTVRKIELPLTILAGWEDLFLKPADPTASEPAAASSRPANPAGERGSERSGQKSGQEESK
jgi:hypothetical protein